MTKTTINNTHITLSTIKRQNTYHYSDTVTIDIHIDNILGRDSLELYLDLGIQYQYLISNYEIKQSCEWSNRTSILNKKVVLEKCNK